jgi:hypothetical protein
MENVNERRRFVKGIGFFAALLGGGSAAGAAANAAIMGTSNVPNHNLAAASEPVVEDTSHLAPPENATTIQITGAYGEQPKPQVVSSLASNSYYINGFNQETTHKVSMTVGLDNRLWIKVGDTWKRVALEA